jgi:eukaryotic translation initiation factor 2C
LFGKALESWTFLSSEKAHFSTDGQKTIVSWRKLHGNMGPPDVTTPPPGPDNVGAIWSMDIVVSKPTTVPARTVPARFKYVDQVATSSLAQKTQLDLSQAGENLAAVQRCLDILISNSYDNGVFKLSGNKFFVRNARDTLGSAKLLETIRGYYYTVKPGMGNLLMNFNVATSAFFCPVRVDEFLKDESTWKNRMERISLLKRLRVYVKLPHIKENMNTPGSRIKKVFDIGDGSDDNIEDLTFFEKLRNADGTVVTINGVEQFKTTPTYVTDHLKTCKYPDGLFVTTSANRIQRSECPIL